MALAETIQESRRILDLHDNWDHKGAVGYDESTWNRTTSYLRLLEHAYFDAYGAGIPAPLIGPADEGSIELFWNASKRESISQCARRSGREPHLYRPEAAR